MGCQTVLCRKPELLSFFLKFFIAFKTHISEAFDFETELFRARVGVCVRTRTRARKSSWEAQKRPEKTWKNHFHPKTRNPIQKCQKCEKIQKQVRKPENEPLLELFRARIHVRARKSSWEGQKSLKRPERCRFSHFWPRISTFGIEIPDFRSFQVFSSLFGAFSRVHTRAREKAPVLTGGWFFYPLKL